MARSSTTPFWIRRFHSLLGVIPLGAFLALHALTVSVAFYYGYGHFDTAIAKFHSLPFAPVAEIGLIGVPILIHALLGLWIWWRGKPNPRVYDNVGNWLYTAQRWTGGVVLVFILSHVWIMRLKWNSANTYGHDIVTAAWVNEYLRNPGVAIWHIAGTTCVVFHFTNGLRNSLVTWGITIGERAKRVSSRLCLAAGIVIWLCFMMSWWAFVLKGPDPERLGASDPHRILTQEQSALPRG